MNDVGDQRDREVGDVRFLKVDDPIVLSQRSEELTVPDVHRVDTFSPTIEEGLGETTCGGSGIQGHAMASPYPERIKCMTELDLTAQGGRLADRYRSIRGDEGPRVRHRLPVDIDEPGFDGEFWIVELGMELGHAVGDPAESFDIPPPCCAGIGEIRRVKEARGHKVRGRGLGTGEKTRVKVEAAEKVRSETDSEDLSTPK